MARTAIWHAIATTLKKDIATGQYAPGDKLPTEAALAVRFGVNRHTVRHALRHLAEEDLVYARRGAGVFVTQVPIDYPISKRVRFHQNLNAAGRIPAKDILSLQTRPATHQEQAVLDIPPGAKVHDCEGLSLADKQPIALFRSVFPAGPFPDLLEQIEETRSVTKALALNGVADYTRASTRIKATLATAIQALHLKIDEGAPILHTTAINISLDGRPVEFGTTWYAGDRIALTLNADAES